MYLVNQEHNIRTEISSPHLPKMGDIVEVNGNTFMVNRVVHHYVDTSDGDCEHYDLKEFCEEIASS